MPLSAYQVAEAFRHACRIELDAPKPGNVHRFRDGHGMTVADFLRSAEAAAPHLAAPVPGVGRRILEAVRATRAAVGQNTNLGILLLAGPLAEAALFHRPHPSPETALEAVLRRLTRADAAAVFAAIRLAAPGGLGRVPEADVHGPPPADLGAAMRLAASYDRIAWNWSHGFADIFGRGRARLRDLTARGWCESWCAAGVFLDFLARLPDSHIARKSGPTIAARVRRRAAPLARRLLAARDPAVHLPALLAFDRALKEEGLNPGTSADLTVAVLFAARLFPAPQRRNRCEGARSPCKDEGARCESFLREGSHGQDRSHARR